MSLLKQLGQSFLGAVVEAAAEENVQKPANKAPAPVKQHAPTKHKKNGRKSNMNIDHPIPHVDWSADAVVARVNNGCWNTLKVVSFKMMSSELLHLQHDISQDPYGTNDEIQAISKVLKRIRDKEKALN